MKTAIFIRENRTQVVLTPENEWERNVCEMMGDDKSKIQTHFSQFVDVQGGWTMNSPQGYRGEDSDSLILVLDKGDSK